MRSFMINAFAQPRGVPEIEDFFETGRESLWTLSSMLIELQYAKETPVDNPIFDGMEAQLVREAWESLVNDGVVIKSSEHGYEECYVLHPDYKLV